jgi:hypothetical protein
MPKDFNYALRQNGLGEYARGSRRPVKSRGSVTIRPSYQRQTPLYNQRATMPVYTPQPTPVWGEYAGHSNINLGVTVLPCSSNWKTMQSQPWHVWKRFWIVLTTEANEQATHARGKHPAYNQNGHARLRAIGKTGTSASRGRI